MKKKLRILLLVDWTPQDDSLLLQSLRKTGIDCEAIGINFHQSRWTPLNKVLFHWPKCLWAAIRAFQRRYDYDYMLAMSQTIGTFLGLIKFITFSTLPKVFILDATIVERRNLLLDHLRRCVIASSWKQLNHIGFMSSAYMHYIQEKLNLPPSICVHFKLPVITDKDPGFHGYKVGGYLYSVGRSFRDYETLMEAARLCSHTFIIATSDTAMKGLAVPKNVTIRYNVFGEEADALMRHAAAVIIPLSRVHSPAGEYSMLEAMYYGKPLIITKTLITQEYVVHGENGYLVPWQNPNAIADTIHTIFNDPDKAEALGLQARRTIIERHSIDEYSKKVIDIIENNLYGNQVQ